MKYTFTLDRDAEKFCAFLKEHYVPAKSWVDPLGYCLWNMSHGFMASVIGEDDKVIAMGVARPVDRPGFGCLPFYFNANGKNLHMDLLVDISDDTKAILALRAFTMQRFGPRETVAMFRHSDENIRIYPYDKFWKNLLRLKRAQMKKEKKYGTEREPASST